MQIQVIRTSLAVAVMAVLTSTTAFARYDIFNNFKFEKADRSHLDKSTVRILIHSNEDYKNHLSGQCSGVFISNKGYILTAKHCVDFALTYSFAKDFDSLSLIPDMNRQVQYLREQTIFVQIEQKSLFGRSMSRVAPAKIIVSGGQIDIAKFLDAKNTGRSQNEMEAYFYELYEKGFGIQSDFAILKVNEINNTTCLKVSAVPLTNDLPIYHLGFPGKGGVAKTDGTSFFASEGKVIPNAAASCATRAAKIKTPDYPWLSTMSSEIFRKEIYPGLLAFFERLMTKLFGPELIPSTAILDEGMSGGPTIDEDGNLIGVNIVKVPDCREPNFSNSIYNIVGKIQKLHESIGTPSASELFNCR